jgi:hypothetical protein
MESVPPAARGLPFDRVEVPSANGSARGLSASEFLALPLAQRIGFVLQGQLRFFAAGAEVDRREALRWLRELATRR